MFAPRPQVFQHIRHPRHAWRPAAAVVGLFLAAAVTGCAGEGGLITYAAEARQQGVDLYNQGKYADAAGSFQSAVRQDPRDYRSYYYLGRTYEAERQYFQAVQAYRTSLEVMARSLVGREDVALRQKVLESLASAAGHGDSRELEQTALQNRQTPTAEDYFVLAKVYRHHGDVDSALDAYSRAASMDPNNVFVAKEYGLFLTQVGQNARAGQELGRAYVLNRRQRRPEDPEVIGGLRRVGVVPGPSLGDEKDLAPPLVPVGPLPSAEDVAETLQKPFTGGDTNANASAQEAPRAGGSPTAGVPRE